MKVLHAINKRRGGGGAENAALATIEVLGRHGVEVRTFVRDSKDLPEGLRGRVQAFASSIYARGAVREFTRMVDDFAPDLVHAHELFPLISAWILPHCTRRGIPVVVSLYDYRFSCPVVTHVSGGSICTRCAGGREYWAVLKNCRGSVPESIGLALHALINRKFRLYRDHVARYTTTSDFTRHWLVQHGGLPAERAFTLHPMVDIPREPVDPATGEYVAYAGRFAPEKGVATLIAAIHATRLPLQLAGDSLEVVGANGAGYIQPVLIRGKELVPFYRRARMLVVPSTWFETFGIVAAEAMSHGVPVVASRIGALAELVEDGVNGLLFAPGNAVDLAAKIDRLWRDADLCRRLGRAAREKVARICSADAHAQTLLPVYAALTAGANAASG